MYSREEADVLSHGGIAGGLADIHNGLKNGNESFASSASGVSSRLNGMSMGAKQRAIDLSNSIYNMGRQAGLSKEDAATYANDMAVIAYNDDNVRNATDNWDKRGVMSRDPESARTVLANSIKEAKAANPDEAGRVFLDNMTCKYVQGVSNSKAPITGSGNTHGFNASNTNYEYSEGGETQDSKLSDLDRKSILDNLF